MGLFSFVFKLGVVAYAIDWLHHHHHEWRESSGGISSFSQLRRTIEDASANAAGELAQDAPHWLRHCKSSWAKRSRQPAIASAELPDGRSSLEIDVPGMRKSDLVLSVNEAEKVIVVQGTTPADAATGNRERAVAARIKLPAKADTTGVQARLDNGVLNVSFARTEFEGRRISIE
ncbi:hypothetical protein HDU82_007092 [Entophlyctis luteolus]|nr:hypothetical protein HDU82_007092 [Entophlyctis luteolus]KAJ3391919.1 hypothetical protein HDU84_005067 [Entophlyctis sp. JEL0112]